MQTEIPTEQTYQTLDSLIISGIWDKDNNTYLFGTMWGNGLPAPKGENEEEDMYFSLSVEKESKFINIKYGTW